MDTTPHLKLIEESGELVQAISKLILEADTPNAIKLRKHFIEELADVRAALEHVLTTDLTEEEQLTYYRRFESKLIKRRA